MSTYFTFVAPRGSAHSRQLKVRLSPVWRWGWASALALALAGCGTATPDSETAQAARSRAATQRLQSMREAMLQTTWRGQPCESLFSTLGEPPLTLNILGYRPLQTLIAVYGVLDQTSKCIDAFTVVKNEQTGQWTVADYFCR